MGVVSITGLTSGVTLGVRSVIGRSAACSIRVDDPRVSAEHACVYWSSGVWHLRDLGSTNGTWVAAHRLSAGVAQPILEGQAITIGAADGPRLQLVDASAPVARAVAVNTGITRVSIGGLLHLPDEDDPALAIFHDDGWVIEHVDGTSAEIADHDVIQVCGNLWRVHLPPRTSDDGVATTESDGDATLALERCHLHFRVSRDEEYVELHVVGGARTVPLLPRAFHYTLLTLARQRIADASAGVPAADQGWVYADHLARMLGTTKPKLNLDVCRARQQLADAEIDGAARIVERRTTTQQLRIGVAALDVVTQ